MPSGHAPPVPKPTPSASPPLVPGVLCLVWGTHCLSPVSTLGHNFLSFCSCPVDHDNGHLLSDAHFVLSY